VLRAAPRSLTAAAALIGVFATFSAGSQTCGILQWGAGNGYPRGPYASPAAACAVRNGAVDDLSEGYGSGAVGTYGDGRVQASSWQGTPTGGYPGSSVYCDYTITITGGSLTSPLEEDLPDSLPNVFAVAPTGPCPQHAADSAPVHAADVLKLVDAQGAERAAGALFKEPGQWADIQRRIATGKSPWIRIAVLLLAHADGGARQGLAASLAEALDYSPGEVLREVRKAGLKIEGICLAPDAGDKRYDSYRRATSELRRRISAVSMVAEASLQDYKNDCLDSLAHAQAGLKKSIGEK